MQPIPQRISVVGTTGTGKTTLALRLSVCLGIPHIELDAVHWKSNWEPLPVEAFRKQVSLALEGDAWVVDGNYSKVRDIIWERANTVVWLDYSLARVLYQLFRRTLRRVITRENLWNDNREYFRLQFFSQDSIFLWAIKTHPKRKKMYPALFANLEHRHLTIERFRSPHETQEWIQKVESFHRGSATN